MKKKAFRDLVTGLSFLAPNIIGFCAFVLFPLLFSLFLAFTNWDLQFHNMFKSEPLRFVGFGNISRLIAGGDFMRYLGNTLFMMMGIPFGIAGSLLAAILLSQDRSGGGRRVWVGVVVTSVLTASLVLLVALGAGASAMTLMISGVAGVILVLGALGGNTVHRTLFYMPHFTAGVATYILWKQMYSPHTGPINNLLRPILARVAVWADAVPSDGLRGGAWALFLLMALLIPYGVNKARKLWHEGEFGLASVGVVAAFIALPTLCGRSWIKADAAADILIGVLVIALAGLIVPIVTRPRLFRCRWGAGFGDAAMLGLGLMVLQFVLLGLGNVVWALPAMAADGLNAPEWLQQYHWAKPAIMIMALWAAIGSNNMILYLAGLSNVPPELYEASSIDGAGRFQTFWNVTWPQLAPVTFFIVVMSTIQGLQGGFEMARSMTQGGPAGATTTLSYYVYMEGFETGRLGYASAIAWSLFLMVFVVTMINWRFGNRYVND